ncbi:MAG: MBL fold metallo-hydrolase [Thermoplasmata archaeon]|nr:MAG: MBL fold metallo-hydrolase [Thermoplasmata archaeon]
MRIKILGSGQDAGIPHTGCNCEVCDKARDHNENRRLGPSIAILDDNGDFCYLIDASPDFKYQLDMIRGEINEKKRNGRLPISGILLTHAHLGHFSGLWQLGREAVNENELPVFCTLKMKHVLLDNYPFNLLIQNKNIEVVEIHLQKEFKLNGLTGIPIKVPHRDEVGDTVGYIFQSKKRIIYIPDIDSWTDEVLNEIRNSDIAIIDGTFYSKGEIPEHDEVPHPSILETITLLGDIRNEIYFTHINHTNPINIKGQERKELERKGYKIAYDGMTIEI